MVGMKAGADLGAAVAGGSGARRGAAAATAGDEFGAGADISSGVPILRSAKDGAPGNPGVADCCAERSR
jgi:hypothetical protein